MHKHTRRVLQAALMMVMMMMMKKRRKMKMGSAMMIEAR